MDMFTLIWRSLRYDWRSHLLVLVGVAIGTAVWVGSLLLGDSYKASLKEQALERLGRVAFSLVSSSDFREGLASDLQNRSGFEEAFDAAIPMIQMTGSAKKANTNLVFSRVQVLGVPPSFWTGAVSKPAQLPEGRQVLLNQNLADDLAVKEGEALIITLPKTGQAPVDSFLGRRKRSETQQSMRFTVAGVIPARDAGAFGLKPDFRPRTLYVALDWLQKTLEKEGRVNTVLVCSEEGRGTEDGLKEGIRKTVNLEDLGLRFVEYEDLGYLSLESRGVLLPSGVETACRQIAETSGMSVMPCSVYLANRICFSGQESPFIPYSVVAAPPPETLTQQDILLNEWAALDLKAEIGDRIDMTCFVSDGDGGLQETTRTFTLKGILAMGDLADDAGIVPRIEGLTDEPSIESWDPGFPLHLDWIRPQDEAYWTDHKALPKALLCPEVLRDLWGSSGVTSLRVTPDAGMSLGEAREILSLDLPRELNPFQFGMILQPVRAEALAQAQGSTDFSGTFMAMSLFLIASSSALTALLLRLSLERRSKQFGILMAVGFTTNRSARLLKGESLFISALGALAGLPLGILYAGLLLHNLSTGWSGASPGLRMDLHVSAQSLCIGFLSGLVVAGFSILWASRLLKRVPCLTLLGGWQRVRMQAPERKKTRAKIFGSLALASAMIFILLGLARTLSPVMAFFAGGALLLVGLLALQASFLSGNWGRGWGLSLPGLAFRSLRRNPGRSLLTTGLMAAASFVLITVAANETDLSQLDVREKSSGAGGFNLVVETSLPLYQTLSQEEGLSSLQTSSILSLRVRDGDDVSCLNLQRPQTPRVVSVPRSLRDRNGFRVARTWKGEGCENVPKNPWDLLTVRLYDEDGPILPAFADASSAQWILRLSLGKDIVLPDKEGRPVRLRLVGVLGPSLFAGDLLISEENFVEHFGTDTGFRRFLLETPPEEEKSVTALLRQILANEGLEVSRSADILAGFAKVQNTYLMAFEVLSGLGLFLGSLGLVVVLLRNGVERRSELAMMQAVGLRASQVAVMMVLENGWLVLTGMVMGGASALVAVAPQMRAATSDVRWGSVFLTLLVCFAIGMLSSAAAAGWTARRNLVSSLRSE